MKKSKFVNNTKLDIQTILKFLRAKNISDIEIAEKMQVSLRTIYRWRIGESKPSHATINFMVFGSFRNLVVDK